MGGNVRPLVQQPKMPTEEFIDLLPGATERRTVPAISGIEKKNSEQTTTGSEEGCDGFDIPGALRRLDGAKTRVLEDTVERIFKPGGQSKKIRQQVLLATDGRMRARFFQSERGDIQSRDIETARG